MLDKFHKLLQHNTKKDLQLISELVEYLTSFAGVVPLLVTDSPQNFSFQIEIVSTGEFARNTHKDKFVIFSENIDLVTELGLGDIIADTSLTFILDRKNDFPKHEKILTDNKLSTRFVGENRKFKNIIFSIHGKLLNIPRKEKLKLKKILAIVSTHNDEDIVGSVLEYLISQDLDILLLENWSTDNTPAVISKTSSKYPGRIFVENFPKDGPSSEHMWPEMLYYKINNPLSKKYDWLIHYDSDEIRKSPWFDKTLSESISFVDQLGYNAINFSLADFRPTKEGFSEKDDPEEFFDHFELRDTPGCFTQIKAFKNLGNKIDLSTSFGHEAIFEGRKTFPIKFLLKHYPLRSTNSARKKIFQDRRPRYAKKNREKGAHTHYDRYEPDHRFIWDPSELLYYGEDTGAYRKYLLEFLTGVRIRNS